MTQKVHQTTSYTRIPHSNHHKSVTHSNKNKNPNYRFHLFSNKKHPIKFLKKPLKSILKKIIITSRGCHKNTLAEMVGVG